MSKPDVATCLQARETKWTFLIFTIAIGSKQSIACLTFELFEIVCNSNKVYNYMFNFKIEVHPLESRISVTFEDKIDLDRFQ